MKKRLIRLLAMSFCLVMLLGSISASAVTPYTTYTYDVNGKMVESPHAFVPDTLITQASIVKKLEDKMNENGSSQYTATDAAFGTIEDICTDDEGYVYLSDSINNKIMVLDPNYALDLVIKDFVNDEGVADSLSGPTGLYVSDTEIYVADTKNKRIVIFNKRGEFVCIVPEPSSDVMPENSVYTPIAVAADQAGRVYVISSTTNYGVISLNRDGSFNTFIGPQKVSIDAFQIIWRKIRSFILSDEQISAGEKLVPTEYNNLTIDDEGFIYVTTSSIDAKEQQSAIDARSKAADFAPVKKLNPNGSDVMNRNGFYPPSGEVDVNKTATAENSITGASVIVDVALGPSGMWSIIDQKRSRIFTYDRNGNLLFAFGDKGEQIGQGTSFNAVEYQGDNILVLSDLNVITVYKRTEYGDLVASALQNTIDQNFEETEKYYTSILQHNNNYDSAYIGLAQNYYRDGDYEESMKYCMLAYDTENYSVAFAALRKQWIEKYVYLIPIVIVAFFILLSKGLKYIGKVNKKGLAYKEKRSLKEQVCYGFHILTHPFDGFWDLKHEKRGSIMGATAILIFTILAFIYQSMGRGYLYNPYSEGTSFFAPILAVAAPVALWVVSNWCLTTLFEGEGSLKDVYVATCYALLPLPLTIIPSVICSNFTVLDEQGLVNLISSFGFIWAFMLLFFGTMVIHDYGLMKNVLTILGSIVGMAFIMFLGILFSSLVQKIFAFVYNIFTELKLRGTMETMGEFFSKPLNVVIVVVAVVAFFTIVHFIKKGYRKLKETYGKAG